MSDQRTSEQPMLRIPRSANPTPTATRLAHRRVPVRLYLGGAAAVIVGLLAASMQLGWFSTSGRVDADGQAVTLTASSTGADLKGWMTIQQVLDAYGITKADFYRTFAIPSDVATDATLGPLGESVPGFELTLVRTWIDARATGGTTPAATPVAVTASAATAAVATATPVASASARGTADSTGTAPVGTPSASATHAAADGTEPSVRGTTTIDELVTIAHSTRAELADRFGIPTSTPGSTPLSQLDGVADVSVPDLRAWATGA